MLQPILYPSILSSGLNILDVTIEVDNSTVHDWALLGKYLCHRVQWTLQNQHEYPCNGEQRKGPACPPGCRQLAVFGKQNVEQGLLDL